jgi:hypothetical protein
MENNVQKLKDLLKLANVKKEGTDLFDFIAAFTIYTSAVDFFTIQSARLLEQIIAKGKLENNENLNFEVHLDSWFYENKVSTRRILIEIQKFLPFTDEKKPENTKELNEVIKNFLNSAHNFLDNRNKIIHGMGNPQNSLEDVQRFCKESFSLYKDFQKKHEIMSLMLAPYSLTADQRKLLYS